MFLKGNELFLIVDILFDSVDYVFNTREEAENELRMLKERHKNNKIYNPEIRHFKEVK